MSGQGQIMSGQRKIRSDQVRTSKDEVKSGQGLVSSVKVSSGYVSPCLVKLVQVSSITHQVRSGQGCSVSWG